MSKIILVDDDRELLNIASALLVHAQFDVYACETAMEALEQIRKQDFDVVITDANMSPHTGYDLIRSIKTIPSYDMIPIAMLTGRREKRDVERAISAGAQDYIVKPLDPELFIKKVTELASLSEKHQRIAKYAEVDLDEVVTCELPMVVIGVTEHGILLESDHLLRKGTVLKLNSEFFSKLGAAVPQVRVMSCTTGEIEGTFEVRTSFEGMDERGLAKLRQYIHSRTLTKRTLRAS